MAQSFRQYLLADYLDITVGQVTSDILARVQKTLGSQNIAGFIGVLQATFASIPHTLFLPQEAYYHSLVNLLLKLSGFIVHAEPMTNLGRIDAVLDLPEAVYILEFKMTSAQQALQQIRARQYDLPFRNSGKPIYLLGIAFDPEQRNIADWVMERSEG